MKEIENTPFFMYKYNKLNKKGKERVLTDSINKNNFSSVEKVNQISKENFLEDTYNPTIERIFDKEEIDLRRRNNHSLVPKLTTIKTNNQDSSLLTSKKSSFDKNNQTEYLTTDDLDGSNAYFIKDEISLLKSENKRLVKNSHICDIQKAEIIYLNNIISKFTRKLNEGQCLNQDLNRMLNEKENMIENFKDLVSELEIKLEDYKYYTSREYDDSENQNKIYKIENYNEIENKLKELNKSNKYFNIENQKLNGIIQALKSENSLIKSQFHEEMNKQLKRQDEEMKLNFNLKEEALKIEYSKEIVCLKEKIFDLNMRIERDNLEISKFDLVKLENESLKEEIQLSKELKVKLEKDMSLCNEKVIRLESEMNKIKKEREDLKKEIEKVRNRNFYLNKELSENKEKNLKIENKDNINKSIKVIEKERFNGKELYNKEVELDNENSLYLMNKLREAKLEIIRLNEKNTEIKQNSKKENMYNQTYCYNDSKCNNCIALNNELITEINKRNEVENKLKGMRNGIVSDDKNIDNDYNEYYDYNEYKHHGNIINKMNLKKLVYENEVKNIKKYIWSIKEKLLRIIMTYNEYLHFDYNSCSEDSRYEIKERRDILGMLSSVNKVIEYIDFHVEDE